MCINYHFETLSSDNQSCKIHAEKRYLKEGKYNLFDGAEKNYFYMRVGQKRKCQLSIRIPNLSDGVESQSFTYVAPKYASNIKFFIFKIKIRIKHINYLVVLYGVSFILLYLFGDLQIRITEKNCFFLFIISNCLWRNLGKKSLAGCKRIHS